MGSDCISSRSLPIFYLAKYHCPRTYVFLNQIMKTVVKVCAG